ncbi:hypothetical protein Lal_00012418 [Lupinus albus]|nr:hypothetical protein Lal_00012418 [Lupinus albus]
MSFLAGKGCVCGAVLGRFGWCWGKRERGGNYCVAAGLGVFTAEVECWVAGLDYGRLGLNVGNGFQGSIKRADLFQCILNGSLHCGPRIKCILHINPTLSHWSFYRTLSCPQVQRPTPCGHKTTNLRRCPTDVHKNPLPNHGNQGINAVEGAQGESYIWEVPEIKTPMKVIFQEMCKHRMVEKMMEDEDPNSCEWHGPVGHTLEDCPEFKLLLQKMLDMRLITVERGPLCQSVNAITQGEGDTSQTRRPSMTRFLPVMNVPHNAPSYSPWWVPVMKVMKPVTKSRSQPLPYKSDKAVPWVYGGDSTETMGEPLEVTNVAGVSRITRSGRVYGKGKAILVKGRQR